MILVTMDGHRHVYPISDILHPFYGPVRDLGDGLLQAGEGPCIARVYSHTIAAENGRVLVQTRLTALADSGVSGGSAECDTEREWSEAVAGSDVKREVKRQMYGILSEWTGIRFPWGSLTGIRPTLIARECLVLSDGDFRAAALRMETMYGVDPGKASLAVETAKREDAVQQTVSPESVCVYVGIPFCPSRCSYCSFTLPECAVRMDLAEAYVDTLVYEAKNVFSAIHTPVACVYFGGGTPTSLAAPVFKRMIAGVLDALPMQSGCEITVEAGRPDTLTAEKLLFMQNHGVGRVCVNPQTMHDVTLRRIGRRHTAGQVAESVDLVRSAGIPILNMDLIAGLPGESPEDFAHSLRTVMAWHPENVTVHALSMKRKSRLTDHMRREGRESAGVGQLRLPDTGVAAMMDDAYRTLSGSGMHPYYLYRQKDAVGGLENVGYAAPGTECRYNVSMMGDHRSVIGLGSGAMSKRVDGTRVERIPTVREIGQYIDRAGETANRIIDRFSGPAGADSAGGNPL